jgi:hypothetical protein
MQDAAELHELAKSISTGAGLSLSKLKFRFENDNTLSTGERFLSPKSKVWTWIKILPKARHFGRISCPNCLLSNRLDEHISYKTSPSALISATSYMRQDAQV